MKSRLLRTAVDISMAVVLLFQMTYSRVGEMTHEWLGMLQLVLVIVHHILNRRWVENIRRGRYTPYRIAQTVLIMLITLTMLGSIVCGILLSKHLFASLYIHGIAETARIAHMLCVHWNFVFLALHAGLHMGAVFRKHRLFAWVFGLTALAFGSVSFAHQNLWPYMTGRVMFFFVDESFPLVLTLLENLAIMGLFLSLGAGLALLLNKKKLFGGNKNDF